MLRVLRPNHCVSGLEIIRDRIRGAPSVRETKRESFSSPQIFCFSCFLSSLAVGGWPKTKHYYRRNNKHHPGVGKRPELPSSISSNQSITIVTSNMCYSMVLVTLWTLLAAPSSNAFVVLEASRTVVAGHGTFPGRPCRRHLPKRMEQSRRQESLVILPMSTLGDLDPLSSTTTTNNNSASSLGTKKKLRQFSRYLEVECWKRAELRGLEPVLQAVANACKQINRIVQRAQTDDMYGAAHSDGDNITNIQGEVQQKLDVLCNDFLLRAFCGSSRFIHSVASEEEDEPQCCSQVMVRASKKCP